MPMAWIRSPWLYLPVAAVVILALVAWWFVRHRRSGDTPSRTSPLAGTTGRGGALAYAEVVVVGRPRAVPTAEEVAAAETSLGTRFPTGYAAFVTRFGEGELAGDLRIYTPQQILSGSNSVDAWRERIEEHWFWDEDGEVLTQQQALACIIVGDTLGGDELIFHPDAPDRILVLAHDDDSIHVVEGGLAAAIEWVCTSGVLVEPIDDRDFVPANTPRK